MLALPTMDDIGRGRVGQLSSSRQGGTMWLWTIASRAGGFATKVGEGATDEARELELRAKKQYGAVFARVEFRERSGVGGGFRIKLRVIWDVPLDVFLDHFRRQEAAERAAQQKEWEEEAVRIRGQMRKTLLEKWARGTLKPAKIGVGWRLLPCDLEVAEAVWDTEWKELIALSSAGQRPMWHAAVYSCGDGDFRIGEHDLAWFRPAVALLREALAESG